MSASCRRARLRRSPRARPFRPAQRAGGDLRALRGISRAARRRLVCRLGAQPPAVYRLKDDDCPTAQAAGLHQPMRVRRPLGREHVGDAQREHPSPRRSHLEHPSATVTSSTWSARTGDVVRNQHQRRNRNQPDCLISRRDFRSQWRIAESVPGSHRRRPSVPKRGGIACSCRLPSAADRSTWDRVARTECAQTLNRSVNVRRGEGVEIIDRHFAAENAHDVAAALAT
jgi:hypothetical protein